MDQQHNYATRTRHKRTSTDDDQYPVFPPPNVVLHPDDANSKVFIAVARAFVSVDNRAMTIKDIAERASRYGLVCQNLSAAAQAVTTYLRQHKARCDQQDDHPLLLSHTLSGTPADDDLVPALYSRSGGDSQPPTQTRLTNFRKGTAVWYLSRATGVPCPFARAGVRLCDYVTSDLSMHQNQKEEQKSSARRTRRLTNLINEEKEREVESCGQKRKRPLRGCVAKRERESSENDERPPKVKLTLRLKPLLIKSTPSAETNLGSGAQNPIDISKDDSDSYDSADGESMPVDSSSSSDEDSPQSQPDQSSNLGKQDAKVEPEQEEPWSLPPYPRRSISIPCYTPSVESSYYSTYNLPPSKYRDPFRRSPSVPFSVATPPPESEDEFDSFHVTMKMMKRIAEHHGDEEEEDDLGWEADLDSEGEGETMFESPGPRSPPTAPLVVKEEPKDVQGMLDAWEGFDSSIGIVERSREVESENRTIKVEMPDAWIWDGAVPSDWSSQDPVAGIKQEDFGLFDSLLNPSLTTPLTPISSLATQFSSFSWSDASSVSPPHEPTTTDNENTMDFAVVRPRARTVAHPSLSSKSSSPFTPPPLLRHSLSSSSSSSSSKSMVPPTTIVTQSTALVTLLKSMSVNGHAYSPSISSPPQPCVSPLQTRCVPGLSTGGSAAEKVVVHTCQPCHPAITATHMEDIPVFQMMLGPFQLLRRIDSDFVNLSPIIAYSGTAGLASAAAVGNNGASSDESSDPSSQRSSPSSLSTSSSSSLNVVTNATVITSGSPEICGTWVTLAAAQAYVRDHFSSRESARALELFLSDALVERFPSALQDFHRLNAGLRALNQFGKHFASTLMVAGGGGIGVLDCAVKISGGRVGVGEECDKGMAVVSSSSSFGEGMVQVEEDPHAPLSKTEQDMFHELCVIPPDWEGKEGDGAEGDMMVLDEDEGVQQDVLQAAMEVDFKLPLPPTPMTAGSLPVLSPLSTVTRRSMHTKKSSISSMSSLSSDSDTLAHSTSTVVAKPARAERSGVASPAKGQTSPLMENSKDKDGRPLRRSKRVADLAAAQPQSSATQSSRASRSRKGGSRNSNSLS